MKMRETTASSPAPANAHSMLGEGGSPAPQAVPGRVKVMHSQRSHARERARSRSPQWGSDLCSWIMSSTSCGSLTGRRRKKSNPLGLDHAPRSATAAGLSDRTFQEVPAPSLAWVQTLPVERELGRSSWQDYSLWSQVVEITNSYLSVWRSEHPRGTCQTSTAWMLQQHSI